jgi:hypothetical protein
MARAAAASYQRRCGFPASRCCDDDATRAGRDGRIDQCAPSVPVCQPSTMLDAGPRLTGAGWRRRPRPCVTHGHWTSLCLEPILAQRTHGFGEQERVPKNAVVCIFCDVGGSLDRPPASATGRRRPSR